jgi:hypothetical protein
MTMEKKKMLKTLQFICGLTGANLLAAAFAGPAQAITVDGILDAGYGASTATVLYDASAPDGNFQAATNKSNTVGYSIYLADQAGTLYGYLQGGPGTSLPFANLYFGLNHGVNGSIFGFELGSASPDAFTPGSPGSVPAPGTQFIAVGNNIEFSIPNSYFEGGLTGLSNTTYAQAGDIITLRLSQSLGYSVAGGSAFYDVNTRLGEVTLVDVPATPLPAALPLFATGLGALGLLGWRKKRKAQSAV